MEKKNCLPTTSTNNTFLAELQQSRLVVILISLHMLLTKPIGFRLGHKLVTFQDKTGWPLSEDIKPDQVAFLDNNS